MITLTDVANIVYSILAPLGYETYQKGNIPKGPITAERITIHAKGLTPETIWKKCFVDVNLICPDIEDEANTPRLNEMEREIAPLLERTGEYDGTTYTMNEPTSDFLENPSFHCHYINLRVLFQIQNTKHGKRTS